jgi:PqqD family protein of HPr-rel-A system
VVPGSSFRWRHWDDEFVLYHEQSGDTHLLNPLAARALEFLNRTPLSADDLAGRLAAAFELDAVPKLDLASAVTQLLARFSDLGLIEPADDPR